MYTRCPRCHTVFAVTEAQLGAREGMVRCGRCRTVFQADVALFDEPPTSRSAKQDVRQEPRFEPEDAPSLIIETQPAPEKRGRRWPWVLLNLLLLIALGAQWLYVQRDQVAALPWVRPWAVQFCRAVACDLHEPEDLAAIEIQRTEIAAHPKFRHAIEVRTALVNRARFAQPFPNLELTLMTATGAVIARAAFSPQEYEPAGPLLMPPNAGESVHFGITRPDAPGPLSYELRVYPAPQPLQ